MEITGQTLTIKKGQGLTYALLDLVNAQKMEMSNGKITLAEWNAAIDKLVEIQQARQNEGKASIFTGGTDRNNYRGNFVVHPNQQIEFTKEEMESLYSAMGVTFGEGSQQAEPETKPETKPEVKQETKPSSSNTKKQTPTKVTPERLAELKTIVTGGYNNLKSDETKAVVNEIVASKDLSLIHSLVYRNNIDKETYEKIKGIVLDPALKGAKYESENNGEYDIDMILGQIGQNNVGEIKTDVLKSCRPLSMENIVLNTSLSKDDIDVVMERITTEGYFEQDGDYAKTRKNSIFNKLAGQYYLSDEQIALLVDLMPKTQESKWFSPEFGMLASCPNISHATQDKIFNLVPTLNIGARQSVYIELAGNIRGTDEEKKAMRDKLLALNNRKVNLELAKHDLVKSRTDIAIVQDDEVSAEQTLRKRYRALLPQGDMEDTEYAQKLQYIIARDAQKYKNIKPGDALTIPQYKDIDDALGNWETFKLWWNR
ncbi:MAG: hypothetical protein LBJ74_05110 [Heliobacteriaceae bacterium]|jgi:hypothetical protein|nr:hypothetical protein [Heliobacteriaceae bacterium]